MLGESESVVGYSMASGKIPRNGANKPDVNVLDKINKEWFIIEGTTCMPRTIPARTMFKRDEY